MKTTILFSTHAADLLRGQLRDLDHEELWAIYLGSGGTLLGAEMLTCGTLTSTPIDARRLLKRALLSDATAVIMAHNHPSGCPTPSVSDIRETRRVHDACRLLEITLLDHLIFGEDSFYSFAEEVTVGYRT